MGKKKSSKSNKVTVSLSEFVAGSGQQPGSGPIVAADPELAVLPTAPRSRGPDDERGFGARYGGSFGGYGDRWERFGGPGARMRSAFGEAPCDWADDDDSGFAGAGAASDRAFGAGNRGADAEPELDWSAARRGLTPRGPVGDAGGRDWLRNADHSRGFPAPAAAAGLNGAGPALEAEAAPEPDFTRRGLAPPAALETAEKGLGSFGGRQPERRREMFGQLVTDSAEGTLERRGLLPPAVTTRAQVSPVEDVDVDFRKRGMLPPAAEAKASASEPQPSRGFIPSDVEVDFGKRGRLPPAASEGTRSEATLPADAPADTRTEPSARDARPGRPQELPSHMNPPPASSTTHAAKQGASTEPTTLDFSRRGRLPPSAVKASASNDTSSRHRRRPFAGMAAAAGDSSAVEFSRRGVPSPAAAAAAAAAADADAGAVPASERAPRKAPSSQGAKSFFGKDTQVDWSQVRRGVPPPPATETSPNANTP